MQGKYNNLTAFDLRELFLANALDADLMSLEDFEKLFGYEIELDDSRADVLVFCSNGMNKCQEHGIDVQMSPLDELFREHHRRNKKNRSRMYAKIAQRAATIIAVIALAALLAQGVAMAFGFNLIDLFRSALNAPEKAVTNSEGLELLINDDIRFYNSMSEMLEAEKISILYPTKFPEGYSFTGFTVIDVGDYIEIYATATEPFISFTVKLGVDIKIDSFDYEENGIKYNILERDDMLQVEWINKTDYYWINVSDEAVISEIIKNLKES